MTDVVRFAVRDAEPVLAEVDSPEWTEDATFTGIGPAGRRGRGGIDAPTAFESHLESVRAAAAEALDVFRTSLTPDEVKLTFGVKLTAGAGAMIARTAIEGNLAVELVWRRAPAIDDATIDDATIDDAQP
jgi:hypothetical protein